MSSPTFSERKVKRAKTEEKVSSKSTAPPPLGPLPDLVRIHRLPLSMKTKGGDTLQVYLCGGPRKEEATGQLFYDIEFDDLTTLDNVSRAALFMPPGTSMKVMMLQQSQSAESRTPTREERAKMKRLAGKSSTDRRRANN